MIRAYVAPTDQPVIAVRTAELECEMPTCSTHQVAGGYCAERGGRP